MDVLRSGQVLLMDGAMGTELYQAGLEPDECGEGWNLDRPQRVAAIHRDYVKAGAVVLLTNTFQANPCSLVRWGREEDLERITSVAIRLARSAVGPHGFVLADIGPILMQPEDSDFSEWCDLARTVESFLQSPSPALDGFLLETCSTPRALAAVDYIRHRVAGYDDEPILLSIAYQREKNGRLVSHSGHAPEVFARHAARHGVAALGVNCGRDIGPAETIEIIRRYRATTDLPLFARPNAGSPIEEPGRLSFPLTPSQLAERAEELLQAGACMIGGCCGTTPAHIAALQPIVERWNQSRAAGG